MRILLSHCYRLFYRILCWSIIALALGLVLLNVAIRGLLLYEEEAKAWLSESLGIPFSATIESARWRGIQPEFDFRMVALGEGESAVTAGEVVAKPDLLKTLVTASPYWQDLHLQGVNLSLIEQDGGRWQIAGVDLVSGGGGGQASVIEKMLLGSRSISLADIQVRMQFSSGTEISMRMDNAQIENSLGFHRLIASAELNDDSNQLDLIIELTGISNRFSELDGLAYAKFSGSDLTEIFSTLIGRYTDTAPDFASQPSMSGEVWANIHSGSRAEFQGHLEVSNIPGQIFSDDLENLYFRSDIAGHYFYFEDELRLDSIQPDFSSADNQWPVSDFRITRGPGAEASAYSLQLHSINLESVTQRTSDLYELPDRLATVIKDLNPSGILENVEISLDSGAPLETLSILADLKQVEIGYFENAPAVRNLSGKIAAGARGGKVSINAREMSVHYPTVYDWWLNHELVTGEVGWELNLEDRRVYVYGSDLMVDSVQGQVRGEFLVDSSTVPTEEGMDFYLYMGFQNSSAEHWSTLVPSKVPESLRTWLTAANPRGKVSQGSMIYRGKVKKGYSQHRTIQLRLDAEAAELGYLDGWPEVTGVNAGVSISNTHVNVLSDSAQLPGIALSDIQVRLNTARDNSSINILAEGFGETDALIDLVRNTSLRSRVGNSLDTLRFDGESDVNFQLQMPLKKELEASDVDVSVNAFLKENSLALDTQNLVLTNIGGGLNYDKDGLNGNQLKASLWGKPLILELSEEKASGFINLAARGDVDIDSVRDWMNLDVLEPFSGVASVDTLFQINTVRDSGEPSRFLFASDLVGVESTLPGTLTKHADEETQLALTIENSDQQNLKLEWEKGLLLGLQKPLDGSLPPGSYDSAVLSVNAETPSHLSGKFLGRFYQAELDVNEWLGSLLPEEVRSEDQSGKILGLEPDFEVVSRRLILQNSNYGLVEAGLTSNDKGWLVSFKNSFAEGSYLQPFLADSFPELHFDSLDLDRYKHFLEETASQRDDEVFDPRTVPSVDLVVRELRSTDSTKGSWSAELRSSPGGLSIENIHCQHLSLSCATADTPSALFWGYDDEGQYTAVNLSLDFGDISDMFDLAGIKSPMTSEAGKLYASVNWAAAPHKFFEVDAFGITGIDVAKGEFHAEASGVGAGIVRLVGLLNVDTWLRRLKLDFSDVAAGGTPYDRLVGDFTLNQNLLTTLTPVSVELPAGKMLLDGSVDLDESDVDARLVVTLPARQNMTWIAALAAGLPTAAGVWVVGKIFDEQVDSLASVSYRVTGPLDDPGIKTERIFDATVEE